MYKQLYWKKTCYKTKNETAELKKMAWRCEEADQRLEWLVKQKWHNDVWLERALYSQKLVERSYGVVKHSARNNLQVKYILERNNLDALGTFVLSAMRKERASLLVPNPIGETFSKKGFFWSTGKDQKDN